MKNYNRSLNGYLAEDGFRCLHCGAFVTADPAISSVQNRNHCPYCLRSRHLDLFKAGDRLAACKTTMKPVGLTVKRSRNRYAREATGELMLVHLCEACGKISINRIAADDVPEALMEIFEDSIVLEPEFRARLAQSGVWILQAREYHIVARALGIESQLSVHMETS